MIYEKDGNIPMTVMVLTYELSSDSMIILKKMHNVPSFNRWRQVGTSEFPQNKAIILF